METPSTDTAYISVFSYPGLAYQSTIKDVRTGPIGYYGGSPGMIQTENGDIYTLSPSAFAAGFSQVTQTIWNSENQEGGKLLLIKTISFRSIL